jgi:phage terminase small subunit
MGRRGPKRKLAAIDRLDGNPSHRHYDETGVEALGSPFIPEHLSDDARGCIEVIKTSMPAGVFSALDSFLLATFGTAWMLHKRACLEMIKPDFEYLIPGSTGSAVPSPWIKIANGQVAIMLSLADRLGLNPTSRAGLKLPEAKRQKSKFAGLLGGVDRSVHDN